MNRAGERGGMGKRDRAVKLDEAGFRRLLKVVANEIADLQLIEEVYRGTLGHLRVFSGVGATFPAFFNAILVAMRTDMIIRLGRLYDKESLGEGCTLTRCLQAMGDHPEWFSTEAISSRLSETYRRVNANFIVSHTPADGDLNRLKRQVDAARVPLLRLRNKLYAHRDLKLMLDGGMAGFLDSHGEVQDLIALALRAWNYCSLIWEASTMSDKVMLADDHEELFRCLRRGIKVASLIPSRRRRRPFGQRRGGPNPKGPPVGGS